MTRPTNRLTARAVATATTQGYHPDGGGLYLQVAPGGTKSWIMRYTLRGKAREMGLGPLAVVSLADARAAAAECRKQLLAGIDPIDARGHARSLNDHTFDVCAAEFIKANNAGWRNAKHVDQWGNTLATYASPIIGTMSVDTIGVSNIVKVLDPIWKTKTETATRVRQRIEAVLDYATVRKFRSGENPARWRGNLDKIYPKATKVKKVVHHPALPYAELPAFMVDLCATDEMSALALRFTILTNSRTNETIGATWDEFNLQAAMWIVPGERMKGGKDHAVPLSPESLHVLAIVRQLGTSGPVFIYRKQALSNGAMLALLERMDRADITVHGFRSTFKDWASEKTDHASEVVEMAMAHTIRSKTEAAYRRGTLLDKRRKLAADWGTFSMGKVRRGAIATLRARPLVPPSKCRSPLLTSAKRRRS